MLAVTSNHARSAKDSPLISSLAISGYRSVRDLVVSLENLTLITGENGTGKSSLYRSLHLLSQVAQGNLIGSLAREGGLNSTLWAGPEKISRDMLSGRHPVQGTVRKGPVSLKLGFSGEDFGFAVDLGLPAPGYPFPFDPEIKVEAMWNGCVLKPSSLFAERRGPVVRVRTAASGEWRESFSDLPPSESMVTHCADPVDGLELLMIRERMKAWRFYDNLRTDRDAPARAPQVTTYCPIMSGDGSDLASAIVTICAIGDREAFADSIEDAFPGAEVDVGGEDLASIQMRQPGLLRPLGAAELSDGTLRYLLLVSALLSPRPPNIMVLNEPEVSLHPSLLAPLARLLVKASERCQIVVVSHSEPLIHELTVEQSAHRINLTKQLGQTTVEGHDQPRWVWPKR